MFDTLHWLPRILGSLILVGLAIGISRWQRVGLEKDMLLAVGRAFVQLIAIGYALNLIFSSQGLFWILLVVGIMVAIAGITAGRRGKQIPHSHWVATIAIAVSVALTLGMLILLQVFPFEPRYIIPVAGMIVGNSMTVTSLVMARLRDDVHLQRAQVEAALALGATPRQAVSGQLRRALTNGMTPIIDSTKTVGLISLPGAMTGMILAGASPLEAVQLQIIVMYMLVGAAAFSGLTTAFLTYQQFFTKAYQLALLGGLLSLLLACVPPTPPPSPTPWPTATSTAAPVQATPTLQARATATRTPTPTRGPTPTPATTTISVWENLPEAQAKALTELVQAFEKKFPYFKVTLHHYDSPEDFMTPLMAGQSEFDVALVSPVLLSSLWTADRVAPMSNFFAPSFLDSFAAVTLEGAGGDGEVWGLSDTAGFHLLLFYNRDLIDPPPTDTDELIKFAERVSRRGQAQGKDSLRVLGVNSYDPLWVIPWLSSYDGWITDKTGRPTLNTAAMQEALKLYLGWQDAEKGIAPVAEYDEVRSQFAAGNLAMVIDGDWAIGELDRAAKIDWGVAPLPDVVIPQEGRQSAAPLILARYWAISRSTSGDRALAAAAFLEFVTRPEWQVERVTRFGLLPTRREALNDPIIVNDPNLRTSAEQMLAGRAIPLGINADALLSAMRDPLRQALDGKLSPAEAAEMMQTNVEK